MKKTKMALVVEQLSALSVMEKELSQKKIYNCIIEDLLPYAEKEEELGLSLLDFVKVIKHLLLHSITAAERKALLNELLHK